MPSTTRRTYNDYSVCAPFRTPRLPHRSDGSVITVESVVVAQCEALHAMISHEQFEEACTPFLSSIILSSGSIRKN